MKSDVAIVQNIVKCGWFDLTSHIPKNIKKDVSCLMVLRSTTRYCHYLWCHFRIDTVTISNSCNMNAYPVVFHA
jgi:hypothetical protein